jgi:hypothetical protein
MKKTISVYNIKNSIGILLEHKKKIQSYLDTSRLWENGYHDESKLKFGLDIQACDDGIEVLNQAIADEEQSSLNQKLMKDIRFLLNHVKPEILAENISYEGQRFSEIKKYVKEL